MRIDLTFLLLALSVSVSAADIVMPPYLQGLTAGTVYVLVECTNQDTVTIQYGTDAGYGDSAATGGIAATTGGTYVHSILLEKLTPGTTYHYRVRQNGPYTADSHFTTCVLQGIPFRLAWMADCRTGSVIFDSVMAHLASTRPLMGLFGGDLDETGTYASWKAQFFRPGVVTFGSQVPWINTPGNHEGWATNTQAFTHAPAGATAQDYFSFDCGDLHVLVLDSQSSLTPGSAQSVFAESDLSSSHRTWKVVMIHIPAYCSGGHGENADIKALTSAVFEKTGVDMLLTGHSHFYQHNLVNGIHHMVIGSAGAPLYDPTNAPYTLKSVKQYNWAVCDVAPASLRLFVFNETGQPLDSLILTKPAAAIGFRPPGQPRQPTLQQNYPNPFNPSTTISYETSTSGLVRLTVHDQLGREVAVLVNGYESAGMHSVTFTAAGLASGCYYYRLSAGNHTGQKMMVLLK